MTVVHIGSLPLQVPESRSANFVSEFVEQMRNMISPPGQPHPRREPGNRSGSHIRPSAVRAQAAGQAQRDRRLLQPVPAEYQKTKNPFSPDRDRSVGDARSHGSILKNFVVV
jgi:hypothetical protein